MAVVMRFPVWLLLLVGGFLIFWVFFKRKGA